MMGPEEVITPLLAPRLDLRGDFFLGGTSTGVMATFLEGRSSFVSGFLFETLATVLGAYEDTPSSFSLAFLSSSFLQAVEALTLFLAVSISI